MAQDEQKQGRLAFLEGMRGFAALYVMLSHYCSMVDPGAIFLGKAKAPEWMQWAMTPFWFGHLAVSGFLVISGFCLQLALFGRGDGKLRDVRTFFRRRALRILPAYYACLAVSLVVCAQITSRYTHLPFTLYLPVTPQSVVAHVFMVHNWNPAWMYKINGVLWSIAIEAQLYLLFPALVAATHAGLRWLLVVVTTLIPFGIMAVVPGSVKLYPWYAALFVFGIVAAHLAYRPNLRLGPQPAAGWIVAIIAVFGCAALTLTGAEMPARDLTLGVAVAAACYSLTLEPSGLVHRTFSWRPLVQVGMFSYSLYLMHHPILQTLYAIRPRWAVGYPALMGYFLLATPIILVGCYLFYLAFERPFLRRVPANVRDDAGRLLPSSLPLRTATDLTWEPIEESTALRVGSELPNAAG